jgi:Ca2+-binding RTX toxin-like protein
VGSLRHTRGLFAGLVAVVALALPASAGAFPGEVTVADCVSSAGSNGCTDPEASNLGSVYGLAIRPNGADLYTTTPNDGVITQFDIGPDGAITYGSCVGDGGFDTCAEFPFEEPVNGFHFEEALVAPEGNTLYLLGTGIPNDRVWDFDLSVAGVVTFDGCFDGYLDTSPCDGFAAGLVNPKGMAISGSDFYVTGHDGASFFHLVRGETPPLAFESCIGEGPPCNNIEHASYYGPTGIAVGADGDDVYVTAGQGTSGPGNWRRALTYFDETEDGLRPKDCFTTTGGECEKVPSFDDPADIVLSEDGKSAYVASGDPAGDGVGSLTRFNRKDNGSLEYAGCFASDDEDGCKAPPHAGALAGARSLVVTKDGSSVYVGGSAAIVEFRRSPNGKLEFAGCVASEGEFGCDDAGTGALGVVRRLAIAPNETDLYATGLDAVLHLEREIPECEDEPATAFGTEGGDTFSGGPDEDVIVALGGDDEVNGSSGDDVLCGGKGNDVLKGGPGDDTCIGGPGKDKGPGCETRRSL